MTDISTDDVVSVQRCEQAYNRLRDELAKVIVGQHDVIEQVLIAIFARGHALLEGVPGLAKTLLVSSLAEAMDLSFKRIQFTPDLMPSDVTGADVIQENPETGAREYRFLRGPLFANLILADEINRTPPKTQASMLEAMQERQISAGGTVHKLPNPFFVLATQNPLEQEGTYPLPEAQLDRFLLQVNVDYPELDAEREMLIATTGAAEAPAVRVMNGADLIAAQKLVRRLPVGESVLEAILALVRSGRPETSDIDDVKRHVAWGPGPRASQALMLACRARAVLEGRFAPSIDDVLALAPPILRHRMALNFSARADGVTIDGIIQRLCAPYL